MEVAAGQSHLELDGMHHALTIFMCFSVLTGVLLLVCVTLIL